MNKSERFFLELLRAGLWDRPLDMSLDWTHADWESVHRLMRTQTVVGVAMDAIVKLPQELRPNKKKFFNIILSVKKIEEKNREMNRIVPVLMTALKEHGCDSLLLKGQGASMNYPNPLHRSSGDIDLFVGFDDDVYAKALDTLAAMNVILHDNNEARKHADLQLDDIVVEVHGSLGTSICKTCDMNMRAWAESALAKEKQVFHSKRGDIVLPPCNFDTLFIFVHLLNHYMQGGVGLRQVCDWMMYMYKNQDQIDVGQLQKDVAFLGIEKFWGLFASMAVKYMGYPRETMPLYDASWDGKCEGVISHIFKTGNFGAKQKDKQLSETSNRMLKKFVTLCGQIPVYVDNMRLFPRETLYCFGCFFRNGMDSL